MKAGSTVDQRGPARPEQQGGAGPMTLDLYGHLFPDRLDDLADRMDSAACAPDVPQDDDGAAGPEENPRYAAAEPP